MKTGNWIRFSWDLTKLPQFDAALPEHYEIGAATAEDETELRKVISSAFVLDPAWNPATQEVMETIKLPGVATWLAHHRRRRGFPGCCRRRPSFPRPLRFGGISQSRLRHAFARALAHALARSRTERSDRHRHRKRARDEVPLPEIQRHTLAARFHAAPRGLINGSRLFQFLNPSDAVAASHLI